MTEQEGPNLSEWRQGDIVLGDIDLPILSTEDGELSVIYTAEGPGVAVVSQSCDVVRSPIDRPFLQVAMLSPATADQIESVRLNRRPRYGYLPGAALRGLVVDFDVVATVDKETVADWTRIPGWTEDEDRRVFSDQLARHRSRFAFPNDYNNVLKPLKKWLHDKKDAASDGGELVRAIEEIRVICNDWANPTVMTYWLIIHTAPEPDREAAWYKAIETLEKRDYSPYPKPTFRIATWDEISAREYITSDRLDLDGVSEG